MKLKDTGLTAQDIKDKVNKYMIETYERFDFLAETAEGMYLYDENGTPYLDFYAGIAVNNAGSRNPKVVAAVKDQVDDIMHTFNYPYTIPQALLAEKVCETIGMDKIFFQNSGTEANEAMIKMARKYGIEKYGPNKYHIVTAKMGFHGRTFGAMSATGQPGNGCQVGFGPMTYGFSYAPYNDLKAFKDACTENTIAIMIEPVQGEGGVHPATQEFMTGLREFCDENGMLLLIDEVQTVPGKMLTLFNLAVNFLSEVCGATIVLCSATQPCLEAADHPLHRQPVDLVPQQKALWDVFKRTDIQNAGCAKLEELSQIVTEVLSSCDSLLVVCNTKKEAAFLFESLQAENCRCFHLSAAMCMQHRRETLQALQSALDKPSADRQRVVCVSTQVGCRMGCRFCASTQAGRVRNLEAGEICSEIYTAQKDIGERISHIVLMGIGEPLDNFDEVMRFLENISSPEGVNIGMRNISLSTCGLVPKIDQLAEKKLQLTLSVSLHAPNNEIRSGMMPVNDAYPVEVLMPAVRRYQETTGRRVSFEYSMVRGVNDSDACARQLADLIRGMGAHVNLIPINPVDGSPYSATDAANVQRFQKKLESLGVNATVRRRLGSEISAACGQLRRDEMNGKA